MLRIERRLGRRKRGEKEHAVRMCVECESGGMAESYGPETTCPLNGWSLWKVITGQMALIPELFWRATASHFVLMMWS